MILTGKVLCSMWMNLALTVIDRADLVTLDLSKFDQPGGKQELANQLRDAVHKVGCRQSPSRFETWILIMTSSLLHYQLWLVAGGS